MKLVVFHSHFRPGGVRRVIELATPHLVAHWPVRVRAVILATGEAPDRVWLQNFRKRLPGTPVKVLVEPAFGYVSELKWDEKTIEKRVRHGVMELVREIIRGECLVWAHNLGLGRNLYLARELTFTCRCSGIPIIAHHHDWWFENRWNHFAIMRHTGFRKTSSVAEAVLAASQSIAHAAINNADATVLKKHFPGLAGWLPNPVEKEPLPSAERVEATRAWLHRQLGEEAPVWLLPSRLLRRKNMGEALLLTRWLRPEAWLVTTGHASSAEEQPYADALAEAAQRHQWRLRLSILQRHTTGQPTVPELLAASEAVVFTSLQEGFGLPYLETAAARRPLLARQLPNISPDLKQFGFTFPQSYHEVLVDPALFNWRAERNRQIHLFAEWKQLMPDAVSMLAGKPAVLAAGIDPVPVPFSRLTLTAQLEVLAQPVEHSWNLCASLNPFLRKWRKRAADGQLKITPWPDKAMRLLGGQAYAKRFLELVPPLFSKAPPADASKKAQTEFIRKKLKSENIYPLLWNSRT